MGMTIPGILSILVRVLRGDNKRLYRYLHGGRGRQREREGEREGGRETERLIIRNPHGLCGCGATKSWSSVGGWRPSRAWGMVLVQPWGLRAGEPVVPTSAWVQVHCWRPVSQLEDGQAETPPSLSHLFNSGSQQVGWGPPSPWGFPGDLVVKIPPASAGDSRGSGSIPGWGRSPGEGNGNPLQCSRPENPVDRRATIRGATVRHDWAHTPPSLPRVIDFLRR